MATQKLKFPIECKVCGNVINSSNELPVDEIITCACGCNQFWEVINRPKPSDYTFPFEQSEYNQAREKYIDYIESQLKHTSSAI